jgi:hypothetical protein
MGTLHIGTQWGVHRKDQTNIGEEVRAAKLSMLQDQGPAGSALCPALHASCATSDGTTHTTRSGRGGDDDSRDRVMSRWRRKQGACLHSAPIRPPSHGQASVTACGHEPSKPDLTWYLWVQAHSSCELMGWWRTTKPVEAARQGADVEGRGGRRCWWVRRRAQGREVAWWGSGVPEAGHADEQGAARTVVRRDADGSGGGDGRSAGGRGLDSGIGTGKKSWVVGEPRSCRSTSSDGWAGPVSLKPERRVSLFVWLIGRLGTE